MNGAEQPETMTSAEVEKTFNWRGWILWPGVMVLLYFLSFGPAVKAVVNRKTNASSARLFRLIYFPWLWAYDETPLHKPLGMYMHLWVPEVFEKNGDEKGTLKAWGNENPPPYVGGYESAANPRLTGEG